MDADADAAGADRDPGDVDTDVDGSVGDMGDARENKEERVAWAGESLSAK